MRYDAEHKQETRRKVLYDALATRARIVPAHFGGVHTAFVEKSGDGLRPVFV